jgi:co-chaperonin GroES (HSP10)
MEVLGNAILIKPDRPPERTPSGKLIIPRTTKEFLPDWGEIVDCGPACTIASKGDRVLFPRKSASVIVIDNKDHYFVNEHQIKFIKLK